MSQHGLQRNTWSNCEYTANRYEYETFRLNIWQLVVGCLAEINMTQSCNFIWKEYRLSEKKGGRKEQRMKEGRKKVGRKEGKKDGWKRKERKEEVQNFRGKENGKKRKKERKKGSSDDGIDSF